MVNLILCPICWAIGGIYALFALLGIGSFKSIKNHKKS